MGLHLASELFSYDPVARPCPRSACVQLREHPGRQAMAYALARSQDTQWSGNPCIFTGMRRSRLL